MALNFITFNQDQSLVAVGTSKGFRQYSTEPLSQTFSSNEGDVSLLEMLFSTSLVALVLAPRLLRIINNKRQSIICELTFPSRILAVRLNRKRLVVVLENEIYVYDISNMNLLSQFPTSPNPNAIIALSPSSEKNYIAYPLPQKAVPGAQAPTHIPPAARPSSGLISPTSGDVMIHDLSTDTAINVIEAHQAPLSCIGLNSTSTLLATASEKGTIIRVFGLPGAEKLYQFRRGTIPARIFSMNFNLASSLLAVSSDSETVHIFRLGAQPPSPTRGYHDGDVRPPSTRSRSLSADERERSVSPGGSEDPDRDYEGGDLSPSEGDADRPKPLNPTWQSMLRRTSQNFGKTFATKVGGYLPSAVQEMWEPSRDFAWVKVRKTGQQASDPPPASGSGPVPGNVVKSVVALSPNSPKLLVATSEGSFLVYRIDLEKGGEGFLEEMHDLMETTDKLGRSALDD